MFMDDGVTEDEIVQEIPVFLGKALQDQLYLLHHPLRPRSRPYDKDYGPLQSARVKHKQKRLELVYSVDEYDPHFDQAHDRASRTKALTLDSSVVPPKTNYVVGVLQNGELHLSPLHAICRMRPSFGYIDDADAEKKAEEDKNNAPQQHQMEIKPVLVKYRRQQTARSLAYQRLTYDHMKAQNDAEEWRELDVYGKNSQEAREHFRKLASTSTSAVPFPMGNEEYLHNLSAQNDDDRVKFKPAQEQMRSEDGVYAPNSGISSVATTQASLFARAAALNGAAAVPMSLSSAAESGAVPVYHRVLQLLQSARLLRFDQMRVLLHLNNEEDVKQALDSLQKNAYLVQGNWVCRSSVIYRDLDRKRVALARDYLLTQVDERRIVSRNKLSQLFRLSLQDTTVIFTELSRTVSCAKLPPASSYQALFHPQMEDFDDPSAQHDVAFQWEFKLATDRTFMRNFPNITEEQKKLLAQLGDDIFPQLERSALEELEEDDDDDGDASMRGKSSRRGGAGPKRKKRANKKTDVKAQQAKRLRYRLSEFFEEMFRLYGVCTTRFINKRFNIDCKRWARQVSAHVFKNTLRSMTIEVKPDVLIFKSPEKPKFEAIRACIIAQFIKTPVMRKGDVTAAVKRALNCEVPAKMYQRIMRVLATAAKNGLWTLKSGTGADDAAAEAAAAS
jgi:DNA-directed RNA polymerase-3 subunit RPC5